MRPLASLVLGWPFLVLASLGCATRVPAPIARGIAVLDSNTQTLGADYQRALAHGTAALDTATRTRDLGLVVENARLARHLHDWSRAHNEKGE